MYMEYARKVGFSVRKEHIVHWTHTRIVKGRQFVCAKVGYKRVNDEKDAPKKFRKLDTRTECLACLHFAADEDGRNWEVVKFVEKHNHPFAQENDSHLLRSHRDISEVQGSLLKSMTGVGIKTIQAYNFMSDEVGGNENVGFCKTDAYNYV
ncbi:Protein FAR1-RELATED SEQUENCE 5 [Platanthera zijinensis]|uniref:Protein FAR1-RELATED SEQUENCE 5 n=1 Tax=Platanthera zijinensis TaxID=2320716 RepID=A0AAP0AX02_9ASPA